MNWLRTLNFSVPLPVSLRCCIPGDRIFHFIPKDMSFALVHVHCIVPGGGLSNDELRFVRSSKKFFIPVKVISKKFRGKFLYLLKQAYYEGKLNFFNEAAKLALKGNFLSLVDRLYRHNWVVFCKKPFKTPAHVVRYLVRYTHRVAIGNSRIQSFDGQSVSFSWKDYKDGGKSKVMVLDTAEFTRRFLQHVLPDRFVKIRHYGLLCSRNIRTKLSQCMMLTRTRLLAHNSQKHTKSCRSCGSPDIIPLVFRNHSSASP